MVHVLRVFTLSVAAVTAAVTAATIGFHAHPVAAHRTAVPAPVVHQFLQEGAEAEAQAVSDRAAERARQEAQAEAQAVSDRAAERARQEAQAQAQAKADADAAAVAAAAAAAARVAAYTRPVVAAVALPAPAGAGGGSIQDIIRNAFAGQGSAAVDWGLRVARCESGYNPNAVGPGGYDGLFQFAPATFRATPYGGGDIFDPVANANAAAWKYAHDGPSAWGCK